MNGKKVSELELPILESTKPEDKSALVATIARNQEKIYNWVMVIKAEIEDWNRQIQNAVDPKEKQIAIALATPANEKNQLLLDSYLFDEKKDIFYRQAAWQAALTFELSREIHSEEKVKVLLRTLKNKGYVVETPGGIMAVNGIAYNLSPASPLEATDAEIQGLFKNLLYRVEKAEEKKLSEESDLTIENFLKKKPGKLILDIPPEEVKNPDGSTKFWRKGGKIQVRSDGIYIFPVLGLHKLKPDVERIKAIRHNGRPLCLTIDSLRLNHPPYLEGIPSDKIRELQLLWHWIKRTLRHLEEQTADEQIKKDFAGQVTVKPAAWFLKGRSGTSLAECPKPWEERSPDNSRAFREVPNPFLLVKRTKEGKISKISIVECPARLKALFASCMGKEYVEEGEKFKGLPYPLNAFLQVIYGEVLNASKDDKKASQISS